MQLADSVFFLSCSYYLNLQLRGCENHSAGCREPGTPHRRIFLCCFAAVGGGCQWTPKWFLQEVTSMEHWLCFPGLGCGSSISTMTWHISVLRVYPSEWLHWFHYIAGQFLEGSINKSEWDTFPHHLRVCACHHPQLLRRRSWRGRLPTRSLPKTEGATFPQLHLCRGAGLRQGLSAQIPAFPFLRIFVFGSNILPFTSPLLYPPASNTHILPHPPQLSINSGLLLSDEVCTPELQRRTEVIGLLNGFWSQRSGLHPNATIFF